MHRRLDPELAALLQDARPLSRLRADGVIDHPFDAVAHVYGPSVGVRPHEVAADEPEHVAPGSPLWRKPFDVDARLATVQAAFVQGLVDGFDPLPASRVAELLFAPEPVLVKGACPSPATNLFQLEPHAFDRRATSGLPIGSAPPVIPQASSFESKVSGAADAIRNHAFSKDEVDTLPTHPEVHRLHAVQEMIDIVHPVLFDAPAPDGLHPLQRGWTGTYRLLGDAGTARLVKEAYRGIPSVHTFPLDAAETLDSNNATSAKFGVALLIPDKEEYLRLGGREHVCDPATREELSIPAVRLTMDARGLVTREVLGHVDAEGPRAHSLAGTHVEGRAKTFVALALARRLAMDAVIPTGGGAAAGAGAGAQGEARAQAGIGAGARTPRACILVPRPHG